MKNLIILFLAVFCFVSCSSDEDSQSVSFAQSELKVESDSGEYEISIQSNCKWDIRSDNVQWVYIRKTGEYPDVQVVVDIKANDTYSERTAVVIVTSEDGSSSSEMKIIQKENKGIIGDDAMGEFSGEMQEFVVSIKTNIDNLSVKHPSWITPVKEGRALSDQSYKFTLSKNESGIERVGNIILSGEGQTWKYTVKQRTIKVLPSKISFKEGESILLEDDSDFILTPVFYPEECTEKELEWTSSDASVVTVSDGRLKVSGSGDAVVTAKSKVADVNASIIVKVRIKATQILLKDPIWGSTIPVDDTWTFGEKVKIEYFTVPKNAYVGEVVCTSRNNDIISISDGYLIANSSKEGICQIQIQDSYSGTYSLYNITVKRCTTFAGFKNINQQVNGIMMSFGGRIRTNGTLEVLSAVLVDDNNRVLAVANEIGIPSNDVHFYTSHINMTSLFGITVIGSYMPNLRFLVSYRYNNSTEIYQEYIDVNMMTEVN